MILKQLYIVRHGETQYNLERKVQGRGVDAPLNEKGLLQSRAFYERYKHENFDKIYVSSLQRTYQSVELFIRQGVPYTRLEGLDEISWGNKEGLPFLPEAHSHYLATVEAWQRGELDTKIGGGESPNEVMLRQKQAMEHILSQEHEQKVLVCMHGRAIRILVCWLLGYPLHYMDNFGHSNLGLYVLNYSNGLFSLVRSNDIGHLAELDLFASQKG